MIMKKGDDDNDDNDKSEGKMMREERNRGDIIYSNSRDNSVNMKNIRG